MLRSLVVAADDGVMPPDSGSYQPCTGSTCALVAVNKIDVEGAITVKSADSLLVDSYQKKYGGDTMFVDIAKQGTNIDAA